MELVGQPGRKLGWWPVTLWECYCRRDAGHEKDLNIIVLNGVGNPSACPHCKKMFKIAGLAPDPLTGLLSPVIEIFALVKPAGSV
jgi:hypothetical protein